MATFIHGIGASENIDSSGEIVSIAGLDISSLDKDGVFNYEHKSDTPAQVVGKILKARKIFSDADCEDEHQLAFWNKVKVPYLYVMGELFDDYSDSAREVAGRFRYDADKKNQNERAVMNFSVEGSKISKEGIIVSRSIARKITITVLPCNKAAVAEIVAVNQNPKKSNIDELFKTESPIEIQILSSESVNWGLLKKEDPNKHASKLGIKPFKKDMSGIGISSANSSGGGSTALSGMAPSSAGGVLGGEGMMRSEKMKKAIKPPNYGPGVYQSGKDYAERKPAESAPKPATPKAPAAKPKLAVVSTPAPKAPASPAAAPKASSGLSGPTSTSGKNKLYDPRLSGKADIKKALDAGSALASPANLTGGAALGKEEIDKNAATIESNLQKDFASAKNSAKDMKVKKLQAEHDAGTLKPANSEKIAGAMLQHPEKPLKGTKVQKSESLQRAEAEYNTWTKREEFETFMKSRMPHLTKSEIRVIGMTMLFQKSLRQENLLKDFYNPGTLMGKSKK